MRFVCALVIATFLAWPFIAHAQAEAQETSPAVAKQAQETSPAVAFIPPKASLRQGEQAHETSPAVAKQAQETSPAVAKQAQETSPAVAKQAQETSPAVAFIPPKASLRQGEQAHETSPAVAFIPPKASLRQGEQAHETSPAVAEQAHETSPAVAEQAHETGPVFADWRTCWFVSTSTDFGLLYLRPRVSFGYGRPHTNWVGIDLNPTFSLSAPGGYGGLRLALPYFDIRVGSRVSYSLHRSALVPQESYSQDDIFIRPDRVTPRSAYLSGEAEITFKIPIGPGAITSELAATYIAVSPDGRFVFEDRLRVVTDPPWIGKARLGYRIPLSVKGINVGVEPAAEVIVPQGRPEPTVRAGVLVGVPLGPRLSIRANFLVTALSPDRIGFSGMNFGEVTLRWRGGWRLMR